MAVISFSEESSDAAWVVAGWAYRQVLADVLALHPNDSEMASTFDRAEAVGYLRLDCLDVALEMRLTTAIKETATSILSGKFPSGIVERFHDEHTTQEYLKGLRMLLEAAESRSA
ncbi:MAG TPA: hypothetical protein VEU96_22385 [Bryobacteraceae bacterium]|nr:hypothetical protein [Bryobacteraceae bacterium]